MVKRDDRLIDLHTHTFFSDGVLSPSELVKKAEEAGLAAIAVTDHDNIRGLEEAIAASEKFGIEVIPGVEITSYPNPQKEFHMLGYFVDWKNKTFQKTLKEFQKNREERAKKVIKNLNNIGYAINFGDLRNLSQGTIVQPHIAWLVISDAQNKAKLKRDFGKIPTTGDFIVKYLIPGAPAYEKRKTVSPKEAIEIIHKVGGIAVLAHPCWSLAVKRASKLVFDDNYLEKLVKLGLDGLEVYAHRENQKDTQECVTHFLQKAKEKDLVVTGGSDYHGFGSAGKELGFKDFYLKVPYSALANLKLRIKELQ